MKTTTITYTEMCQGAQASDLLAALSDKLPTLYNEVARAKEYADLAGDDYDPCRQSQKEISHLIGQLKRMHSELEELRTHRHDWGHDEYCVYCGADGRA